MLIRRAIETDVTHIGRIHQAAIRDICSRDYPIDVIAAWLSGRSDARYLKRIRENSFWIGEEEQACVAFGSVNLEAGKLDALFLDPATTGRGLATQMLRHLERVAMDAGIATLRLDSSLTAEAFYTRHGYSVCAGRGSITLASGDELVGIAMSKRLLVPAAQQ